MSENICWIDTETGGLDPQKNALISFGGTLENKSGNGARFEFFINENMPLDPRALAVNGFTPEQVETFDAPAEAFSRFVELLKDFFQGEKFSFGGHQTHFDVAFLEAAMGRAGFTLPPHGYHLIDSSTVVHLFHTAGIFGATRPGLSDAHRLLAERFPMLMQPLNYTKAHSAQFDARMARDIVELASALLVLGWGVGA